MSVAAVAGRRDEARAVSPTPTWTASARGPRRNQADATARFEGRGRVAVAIADGVGDSAAAALAAHAAADHAVRVAVLDGRADLAVLAARDVLLAAGTMIGGDAALTVALSPDPGAVGGTWTVAWVGDCRAWSWDGRAVHPLTRDHTVASEMQAAGVAVAQRLENVLTTSVRTVRGATEIGLVAVPAPAALVLASDGVHRSIDPALVARLVAHVPPPALARTLVDSARAAGTHDNATALVVETRTPAPVIPTPRRP
ncbi:serine/threonine protein phosphatase [Actinomycetospora endophytica]|uniref:Serine/threonine protein phosphatase n=1 Tax=Actinomycetospora endophytica TaxID=2291215 RepID=A0ABS8P697_9PSEU|nr:serine/threonine protein phosphatase [Actinomycetospora endophytica]MCD2193787.1 serine/threonine protein phosphatase [Actinomycetospora endophytica]